MKSYSVLRCKNSRGDVNLRSEPDSTCIAPTLGSQLLYPRLGLMTGLRDDSFNSPPIVTSFVQSSVMCGADSCPLQNCTQL